MISKFENVKWQISWYQFLCIQNGVEFSGLERAEDLKKKLAAAGVSSALPSIPAKYSVTGSTTETTNVLFSVGGLVLTDPRVSITMKKDDIADVSATIKLKASANGGTSSFPYLMTRIVFSTDGGTTFNNISGWHKALVPMGNEIPITLFGAYKAVSNSTVIFALAIGSTESITDITAESAYKIIKVVHFK